MASYTNFYETLAEANLRLKDTVVLYDDEPYYVLCITDHRKDGVFRMYLDHLGHPQGMAQNRIPGIPYEWYDEPGATRGDKMDEWLENNPESGIIRKMMNSPKFNKFRPFPLGMCNFNGEVVYVERTPTRYTQQGLTSQMLSYAVISMDDSKSSLRHSQIPRMHDDAFYRLIKGEYPRPDFCLTQIKDATIANKGIGFSRNFAFMRGPVDLLFLAYKKDVVGYLPNGDFSTITLANKFRHTKEVVEELELFEDIRVSERS